MKKIEKVDTPKNIFKEAVESITDLNGGYKIGLQALGANSKKVSVKRTKELLGSVDIDSCTQKIYPGDARWDYAVGYRQEVIFIEVHPADTSDVSGMIKKVQWLEKWLKEKARNLVEMGRDDSYYWIPSGRNNILKTSSQYKSLSKHKLVIKKSPFVLE